MEPLTSRFSFGANKASEVKGSMEDLYRYTLKRVMGGKALMVQPRFRSHSDLLGFSSQSALSTARIVTAMTNNKVRILYACARLSVGTNITDNLAKGLSGNLSAAIDIDTGVLSRAWGSRRRDWPLMQSIELHPDTGHPIQGTVFPLWPKVLDLALKAQKSVSRLKTAGWDIAVTDKNEATLIEG